MAAKLFTAKLFTAMLLCLACAAQAQQPTRADPLSDAPEAVVAPSTSVIEAASYGQALQRWRGADDINAWIGARFRYDMARALQLSETQRSTGLRLPIHAPTDFFAQPQGVCVDLARFAVETLRTIEPQAQAGYLMIEFDPAVISGQTLRRHWVAHFQRDGRHWFFADSKRPGHIAGPYANTEAFIAEYAAYRGRRIVAARELPSFERQMRTLAKKTTREPQP
jgi:hypothetical protein